MMENNNEFNARAIAVDSALKLAGINAGPDQAPLNTDELVSSATAIHAFLSAGSS